MNAIRGGRLVSVETRNWKMTLGSPLAENTQTSSGGSPVTAMRERRVATSCFPAAWTARQHQDLVLAERAYRRAVEVYGPLLPDGHPYRVSAQTGWTEVQAELRQTPPRR